MSSNIKVLDGGHAVQLSKYVGEVDGNPLWTSKFIATNPDDIVKTHLDFLKAGSDFIQTFTYQASVPGFKKYLNVSEDEALSLIRKAGLLAIEAKNIHLEDNPDAVVDIFAGIGPYGAILHDGSEYTGDYTDKISAEEIKSVHRPRINELLKVGIKLFAFETIPSKKEALVVVDLMKEYPDVKYWLSFYCKDDKTLGNGDDFKSTAIYCYEQSPRQIGAVGVNCLNPKLIYNLLHGINEGRDRNDIIPLLVYPNCGKKYTVDKGWIPQDDVEPLDTFIKEWVNLGVRYIGGGCGTDFTHVTLIRNEVNKINCGQI